MKYLPLKSALFVENRARFTATMAPRSLAIFHSNDLYPTGADGTLPFKQASDIYWLSGVDQEESVLVLFPNAAKPEQREMLFLTETNAHIAVWEGAKLDKNQAFDVSGIKTVYWLQEWDRVMKELMSQTEHVYLVTEEHLRRNNPVETRTMRLNKVLKSAYPHHHYKRSAPALNSLRAVKTQDEVEVMQMAADITAAGYDRVLRFLAPGVTEYELEAEFTHEFLRRRSRGFAYTPIIGSGPNACVLHYIENNQMCQDGELVLFDVGAEYANYTCDVTRCFPVSGTFTPRQRQVYEAVLRVEKAAMDLLRPGVVLADYHVQVGECMTAELIQLGLITQAEVDNQDPAWPAYKKYFMHGTSHYLGVDVHDYGLWDGSPIQEGMVFTVEPGIYIPEEGLGVRIEDDIVITKEGHINLTRAIPKEVADIEAAMADRA
ncbi:MAG: X-Pro aminopeptidase [Cryomorphaceae bacterium BACL7 MAG-120910-bin2]|jgi:Xaa-Pro aminopeptidase|nr:MAG: X-Pro aminopeptidase [Cryomorphaceae bacterium BACL7 MAG-120910-bin2]KRO68695.1 MAG: X-Pro aminopeptidase [Cryomorphaceae bacterium BACL7 MAG-120322-bin74]KRO83311.1 MAG: X-Pro aminopeptidase [Cryomorphaceae bacterium BACL7 MAG-121220-bin83]